MVEGDGVLMLVGNRTTRESTRGRRGRSRVAGDGVGSRPCCFGGPNGVRSSAGVGTGLWADIRADVAGRGRHGVQ